MAMNKKNLGMVQSLYNQQQGQQSAGGELGNAGGGTASPTGPQPQGQMGGGAMLRAMLSSTGADPKGMGRGAMLRQMFGDGNQGMSKQQMLQGLLARGQQPATPEPATMPGQQIQTGQAMPGAEAAPQRPGFAPGEQSPQSQPPLTSGSMWGNYGQGHDLLQAHGQVKPFPVGGQQVQTGQAQPPQAMIGQPSPNIRAARPNMPVFTASYTQPRKF